MRTAGYLARLRSHRWWVAGYLTTACLLSALLFIVGTASSGSTGLNRRVFPDVGFAGTPVLADVSTEITLDFLDDHPELPRRFFSARWHGFWYLPESGNITFHAAGDDRLDIRLDGELLIRRTPPADMHTATRDVSLDAGVHEIVVEYQQHGGASALGVRWQPRDGVPRSLPAHRLFPTKPEPGEVRLARQVMWLSWVVAAVWAAPLLVVVPFLARAWSTLLPRVGTDASLGARWHTGLRAALSLAVTAVTVRAVMARLPGWNPESLWYDDLVYAANVRAADVWEMITAPLHVAPGLLVIWRGLHALFPDPEWSLQLLPFASAIAAVPVIAVTVRRLTGDDSLAVLGAAVTALNPLLARYSVFVHQYAVEFLITALFLSAAATLRHPRTGIDPGRFRWTALLGSAGTFFSIPSVFVSFPIVNLGAAAAVGDWLKNGRRPDPAIL